jgi:secondary thiamine-phosphate synthase enzyme
MVLKSVHGMPLIDEVESFSGTFPGKGRTWKKQGVFDGLALQAVIGLDPPASAGGCEPGFRWESGLFRVRNPARKRWLVERRETFQSARMKSFRKELWLEVPARRGYVNLTPEVEQAVRASGVREGLCLVSAMHITASVFINDDESGLHRDFERWLERLAPEKPHAQYDHNRTGEDNGDAHLKRSVMGREVVVAVTAGALDLGPWEQIFYGEFDGLRRKRVLIKIIGE